LAASGPSSSHRTLIVTVRGNGRLLGERRLDGRIGSYHRAALAFEGTGRHGTLELDVRVTDASGRVMPLPQDTQFVVTEPTLFDRDSIRGVVLVSIDTLRRDHVGLHGHPGATTPRIDALGRRGIVCDDAVSVSSWTLPAHLSMLTSVEPSAHGAIDGHTGFNGRVPTLAQSLGQAGFSTHAITSHLYVSPDYGVDAGFDHFDYRADRKAAEVADRAIEVLDHVGEQPFFLFLHFYDPHWPYAPDRKPEAPIERPPAEAPPSDPARLLALYDGEIRYTDAEVGRVLDQLDARGLSSHTLVILTSDHGEGFGEHGSYEHLRNVYEEVVRIPLVVRGPGITPRREASQVSLLDVAPTVLDAVGLKAARTHRGLSLLGPVGQRPAYGETDFGALVGPVRTRKLFLRQGASGGKLIVTLDRKSGAPLLEEWYDLHRDPREAASIAPPERTARALRERLHGLWRDARLFGGPGRRIDLADEKAQQLRSLGYVAE
jgi:arylsulfatase A-like enzyme